MKKIILLFATLLFAGNVAKDSNNTKTLKEIFLKKWLIAKYNGIVPNYLKAEPKDSSISLTFGYDLKNKKIFTRTKVKIILPYFEKSITKSKTTISTKTYKFKIVPFLQIYKSVPTLTIKPTFTYKNETLFNQFFLNETLYYYLTHTEYKEITTIGLEKFINIKNLLFKIQKTYYSTDKTNLYYKAGIYYYVEFYKFIRLYGYEMGGERKKLPFIYYHKLFFTYRHTIKDKRYLFFEFTPYIYYSKEYNFTPKLFADISINLKF